LAVQILRLFLQFRRPNCDDHPAAVTAQREALRRQDANGIEAHVKPTPFRRQARWLRKQVRSRIFESHEVVSADLNRN